MIITTNTNKQGIRELYSLTELLNKSNCIFSARLFNKALLEDGFLEIKTRVSSTGETKEYKSLTEKGLKYGRNHITLRSELGTHPVYFEDMFGELMFEMIGG